jgi:hypothetical protein
MAQKFLNGIDVSSTTVVNGSNLDSGSTVLDVQGSQGQLFSVTNSLTGDLFSVSDISGIPILNVNSSGIVTIDGDIQIAEKLIHSGDTNTYIQFPGTNDKIVFATNGSDALTLDAANTATFAGTVNIVGTNSTNQESVLLRGITSNGGDLLGSIRTANTGGYNQEMRFYTSNANGTSDEDLTLTLKPDQSATFAGAITTATGSTFAGAIKITETGTAQHILIGNQDSSGANKPAMIRGVNGAIKFGYGDSWSGEGGTMTIGLTLDTSSNATFAGNITMAANATVDGVDISSLPTSFAPTDAEANVQADWTETTTTSDAFILNKPSTFAPSAHNHDDRYYTESEVNQNSAALKGWVPAYSNSDASSINWNFTTNSLEIQSDTDTTIGASFQARRIEEGETIRVTFMAKASTAAVAGLYIRLYQHNGNMPDGKTHVSNDASASSVVVQEDDGAYSAWVENGAITTDWVTYEKTYTATSDGYVSLVILNWTGIGTNTLYVTNPDIQTTTAGDSDKLDGQEGTYYLDYANFTSTPTIPTDFVSAANGGTFSGDINIHTGASTGTLSVGRNLQESTAIKVTDANNSITANNDSDGNGDHSFILNRVFAGSGASDFKIQNGGTSQLIINKDGQVTIPGDLVVDGSTTTLNTTTVEVEDNIIVLNKTQSDSSATAATSGISIYRGLDANDDAITQASLIFDDADDTWDLTNNLTVAGDVIGASFAVPSGASTGFLKADGSVDSTTYSGSTHNHDGRYLRTHARYQDDLDTITTSGVYIWDVSEADDEPTGAADGLLTIKYWDSSSWATASFQDFHNRTLHIKSKKNGTWQTDWAQVWTTDQLTTTNKTNYDTAYTHSQAAHAPSNAEANVNADWTSTSGDSQILNNPGTPYLTGVTDRHVFPGLAANAGQARKHHIGRVYYCPKHWDTTWQNIYFTLNEETYNSGYVKYHLFGYYNGTDNQTLNLKVVDYRGNNGDIQRYKIVLGNHTDAGWDHSSQNVYYTDIYVEVAYYKSVKVVIDALGHPILHSNPTSGAGITVIYETPTITNITYANETYDTTYIGSDTKIWNSANDGAGSGLDADTVDGTQASLFKRINGEYWLDVNDDYESRSGTWSTGTGGAWGEPNISGGYAYNDGTGSITFTVPTGAQSCWISHLTWNSGGYIDVFGVQSDGDEVFLRRINTHQTVQNSDEGAGQHDGSTITFAGTSLSSFGKIKFQNKEGRFHFTGIAFSSSQWEGTEGTGMIHPKQITKQGSGNGLDADKLDGQQGTYYLDYNNFSNTPTIPTDFVSAANGGDFSGKIVIKEGQVWDATTQGLATGSLHIDPESGTDHAGGAITFGASDHSNGTVADAGIYIRSDGSYGTKMYFSTTDSYATGSKTAMYINHNKDVYFLDDIDVAGQIRIASALLSNQENTDVDGMEVVAQVAHATYTAAFFDFVIKKGTNVRSGTVYACHNGDTTPLVEFTETSTNDLGDTSDVVLSVDISGANMRLIADSDTNDWSVKTLIRAI